MRYVLPLCVLLLAGCASTADILAGHQKTCEKMGFVGKDAAECALRIFDMTGSPNAVRVTK